MDDASDDESTGESIPFDNSDKTNRDEDSNKKSDEADEEEEGVYGRTR